LPARTSIASHKEVGMRPDFLSRLHAKHRQGLPLETSLIAMCCVCGLVRDDKTIAADSNRWVSKKSYEKTYKVTLRGTHFTHTYCTGCFTDLSQRARPNQRTLGTSLIVTQLLSQGGHLGWLRRFELHERSPKPKRPSEINLDSSRSPQYLDVRGCLAGSTG